MHIFRVFCFLEKLDFLRLGEPSHDSILWTVPDGIAQTVYLVDLPFALERWEKQVGFFQVSQDIFSGLPDTFDRITVEKTVI